MCRPTRWFSTWLSAIVTLLLAGAQHPALADHMSGRYTGTGQYGQYSLDIVQAQQQIFGDIRDASGNTVVALEGTVRGQHAAQGIAYDLTSGAGGSFSLTMTQAGVQLVLSLGAQRHSVLFRGQGAPQGGGGGGGLLPDDGREDAGEDAGDGEEAARRDAAPLPAGCWLRRAGDPPFEHWLCFDPGGQTGRYEYFSPADADRAALICSAPFETNPTGGGEITVTVPARDGACDRGGTRSAIFRLVITCMPAAQALDCAYRAHDRDGTARGDGPTQMDFVPAGDLPRPSERPEGATGGGGAGRAGADEDADRRGEEQDGAIPDF